MRKQDIPENLPICTAEKEYCICDQLLNCQPGEIIKLKGPFIVETSPCVKRFGLIRIKSQNFKYKEWPGPRPHDKVDKIDIMYDEDFIIASICMGLDRLLSTGTVTKRQHFFITKFVERIIPPFVETYMRGRAVGEEIARDDFFMSQEEYEGLTGAK